LASDSWLMHRWNHKSIQSVNRYFSAYAAKPGDTYHANWITRWGPTNQRSGNLYSLLSDLQRVACHQRSHRS